MVVAQGLCVTIFSVRHHHAQGRSPFHHFDGGAVGVNTFIVPGGNADVPGGGLGVRTRGTLAPVSAEAPGGGTGVGTRALPSMELAPGGGNGCNRSIADAGSAGAPGGGPGVRTMPVTGGLAGAGKVCASASIFPSEAARHTVTANTYLTASWSVV